MFDLFRALGDALRLDAAVFTHVDFSEATAAAGIAVLAGVSTMLGHVAILKLNRIAGLRLVTSILLSVLLLAVLYSAQAAVTWGVGTLVLARPLPLVPLIVVALIALAPFVFNFVTALPFLGLGIGRLLQIWSYLIWWLGVGTTFRVDWGWALGLTLGGWLVMQLLSRLLHRPVNWAYARLWTLATGRPTMVTSQDVLSGMPFIPVIGADSIGRGAAR